MLRLCSPALLLTLAFRASACGDEVITIPVDCSARGLETGHDQTPPTVAFVEPAAHATIAGVVTLTVTAADDCRVKVVRFGIFNGPALGAGTRGADGHTSTRDWNSGTADNGPIKLVASAEDNHLELDGTPTPNTGQADLELIVANP